jgi:hypothetical protein
MANFSFIYRGKGDGDWRVGKGRRLTGQEDKLVKKKGGFIKEEYCS